MLRLLPNLFPILGFGVPIFLPLVFFSAAAWTDDTEERSGAG